MSLETRMEALSVSGLVHPRPGAVTSELSPARHEPFFLAADKVQE